jgi:hypothetical protein
MLAAIADRNQRGQKARNAGEAEVGTFFVYNDEVLVDSTPLSVTEPYGAFNSADSVYDRSWKFVQRAGGPGLRASLTMLRVPPIPRSWGSGIA